ncbi:MAG: TetR/AcrR family transcriptional regulator, partial [Eggerthellaceae bacterium]
QEGRGVDAETEKKRKSGLTRDVIVDTAYRMIDRDGMGAFTMRALGAELGVSAMAFYAHFSSREEVLVAVLTRFMETLDTDPVPGERWDDTLRRTMTPIHREYCAHPHMNDIDLDPNISYAGLRPNTREDRVAASRPGHALSPCSRRRGPWWTPSHRVQRKRDRRPEATAGRRGGGWRDARHARVAAHRGFGVLGRVVRERRGDDHHGRAAWRHPTRASGIPR